LAAAYFTSFYRSVDLTCSLHETIQSYRVADQAVKTLIERDGIKTEEPYKIGEIPQLKALGWQLLSSECLKHPALLGKFIKIANSDSGNKCVGNGNHKAKPALRDNLRRPFYAQKIRESMIHLGMPPNVPHKYIVSINKDRFVVVSEAIDIMSKDENLDHWEKLYHEGKLQGTIKKICKLIRSTALADANISNVCFTKSGEIAVVDTEPMGLYTEDFPEDLIRKIDRYIQLGLEQLKDSFAKQMGIRKVDYETSLWRNAKMRGAEYNREVYDREAMDPSIARYQPIMEAFAQAVNEEIQLYNDLPQATREAEIRNGTAVNTKWNWPLLIFSISLFPPLILGIYSCLMTCCSKKEPEDRHLCTN